MSAINEGQRLKGTVLIEAHDSVTGELVEKREQNLITTIGKGLVTRLLGALNSAVKPDYMAVGMGTTASAAGDTTLETETYRETINTFTAITTTTTDDTIQYVMTISEGELASGALTEAGLFGSITGTVASGASNTGVLLSRVVFAAINKTVPFSF